MIHFARELSDRGVYADEIGIRYAIWGDFRLRSAHQPLFVLHDRKLVLAGLRAYLQVMRRGVTLAANDFFASIPDSDRRELNRLVARLHGENRLMAGIDDPAAPDFWIGVDAGAGVDGALEQIAVSAEIAGAQANRIVCELMRSETIGKADLQRLAEQIRRRGMRICLDAVGTDVADIAPFDADFVKMRGVLFRNLARVRKAATLIGHLVEGWRGRDAAFMVEGIETRAEFATALEAGATMVQGFLFGAPKPAGALVDDRARDVDDVLYGSDDRMLERA